MNRHHGAVALTLVVLVAACDRSDLHEVITYPSGSTTPPIVFRAAGPTVSQGTTSTTITLTTPPGVAEGDVQVAQVWASSASTTPVVSAPSGWTEIRADSVVSTASHVTHALFYSVAGAANPATHAFTTSPAAEKSGGVIAAYIGCKAEQPVEAAACNFGVGDDANTQQTVFAPPIAPAASGEQLLFIALDATHAVEAPLAGSVGVYDNDTSLEGGIGAGTFESDQTLTSSGATPAIRNDMASGPRWIACQMALAPATSITRRSVSSVALAKADGTGVDISRPPAIAAGDLLLAQVWFNIGDLVDAAPCTPPTGWTELRVDHNGDGVREMQQHIFYRIASASEPSTYAFTLDQAPYVNAGKGVIYVFSGVDSAAPFDVTDCNLGNTEATVAPSIVVTQTNTRWIYTLAQDQSYGGLPGLVDDFERRWYAADAPNRQTIYGADRAMSTQATPGSPNGFQTAFYGHDTYFACHLVLRP